MNNVHNTIALGTALLLTCLAGCASTPATPRGATRDCRVVNEERQAVQQNRQQAAAQQHGAWKAVIPFAVAARYANARSKAASADRRAAELDTEAQRKGCLNAAL